MKNILHQNLLIILTVCLYNLCSCDIINPTEPLPAILKIENVSVLANSSIEGGTGHAISDVWVFVNPEGKEGSDLLGIFPLPAIIPILEEGKTTLTIQAGVKLNNQTAMRNVYPFFLSNQQIFDLSPNDTLQINPTFTYRSSDQIRFDFMNDFELSHDFMSLSDQTQLVLSNDKNVVFEGDKSLTVQLDTVQRGFIISTISSFKVQFNSQINEEELPIGDRQTYIEMHYKNDATLLVSLLFDQQAIPINILKIGPKTEWSKIYIPLKNILSASNAKSIRLVFEGYKPDNLSTARFSWDNVKIVHELI